MMGLDMIGDEKTKKNVLIGLKKVLKEYIENLLPLCENNDLYDDEGSENGGN
jgi:hypothetical protein